MQVQNTLDVISKAGERLNDALSLLIRALAPLPAEFEEWSPSDMFSVADTLARLGSIGGLVESLTALPKDRFALVPASRLAIMANTLENLVQSIERAASQFAQLESWGGMVNFDQPNGILIARDGSRINAKNIIDEIGNNIDYVLDAYIPIVSTTQPRGVGTFVAAARELRKQAAEATKLVDSLNRKSNEVLNRLINSEEEANIIANTASEASRIIREIESNRKTTEEQAAKLSSSVASVEPLVDSAAELAKMVSGYDAQFKQFQTALDSREEKLNIGNQKQEDLIADLEIVKSLIMSKIAEADQMLGGATIAGLSSTYKKQGEEIDRQLLRAREGYYFAVFLMAISVAVSFNLFGPVLPSVIPEGAHDAAPLAIKIFAAIGTRILVLLPSILLVTFARRWSFQLFQLREDYSHKYNIAASVNGFKAQAPNYQQQIAAGVFLELLQKPDVGFLKQKGESSNDIIEKDLFPAVLSAIDKARGKGMVSGKNE